MHSAEYLHHTGVGCVERTHDLIRTGPALPRVVFMVRVLERRVETRQPIRIDRKVQEDGVQEIGVGHGLWRRGNVVQLIDPEIDDTQEQPERRQRPPRPQEPPHGVAPDAPRKSLNRATHRRAHSTWPDGPTVEVLRFGDGFTKAPPTAHSRFVWGTVWAHLAQLPN